jgi:hypothetical protein
MPCLSLVKVNSKIIVRVRFIELVHLCELTLAVKGIEFIKKTLIHYLKCVPNNKISVWLVELTQLIIWETNRTI